jgi:hypothetical protein
MNKGSGRKIVVKRVLGCGLSSALILLLLALKERGG